VSHRVTALHCWNSPERPLGARRLAVVLTLLGLASAVPAGAKTFAEDFGPVVRPLAGALAQSIGRALPVTSASPGIVYVFDFETGVSEREEVILGQLFLERAETVGRNKANLGLSYQRVKIDTLDGDDIGELHDTRFPITNPKGDVQFTIPSFGIDLETHEFTATATYGLTDDLDLNLALPVVYSDFGLRQVLHLMKPRKENRLVSIRSAELGVGDIFLRAKYRLLRTDWARVAGGLVLRVPSGNEDNFQGTGTVELAPMLYASTKSFRIWRWLELQPYLNAGVNFDTNDVGQSEGRYGVGLDAGIPERFTAAVAFLGRHPFGRIARPGAFDIARIDPRTDARLTLPLFGIRGGRPDFYDLSIGGRVNLWRDTLIGFVNAIVPLNADGFRSDVIPLVGIEATF